MLPSFDRYIGVDYSGAETPISSLKGLRVYLADRLSTALFRGSSPALLARNEKGWQELERGDYDWAYQAMEYWPDRVKEKCKTNKSFAIAHGLEN